MNKSSGPPAANNAETAMANASGEESNRGFLGTLANIERREWLAVLLSFSLVLVLMTAYAMLRPIRESLAGDWGNVGLAATWTANFGVSLIAVSAYGAALTRIKFQSIVPAVYVFFSLSFIGLIALRSQLTDTVFVDMGFYVWISLFALFNLSVFWSLMTDVFNPEQAQRVFGFIAAGTTIGALLGPTITEFFIDRLGANGLLLISALLLLTPLIIVPVLFRLKDSTLGNAGHGGKHDIGQGLGKDWYAGFKILVKDPYLLGIAAFILLYVTISTFVYFELQTLTREYDLEFRARVWARMDIATQTLTLLVATLVTGRVVQRFGMSVALSVMPALVAVCVLALAAAPGLLLLGIFQIGRRVGNYALTRPAREMLFSTLSREARFKTKPIIDVVIYRGGDVISAWLFTALVAATGMGLVGIAVVLSGIAVLWGVVAVWLGRRYQEQAAANADESAATVAM